VGEKPQVVWEPQPGPQTDLLTCPVFEVLYGGARGGGKTDGVLGEWISHADMYGEHAVGLMVRREFEQLRETIERSRQIYAPLGAEFREKDRSWRFPNGARLRFAYLDNDADAEAYQGHSYTRLYVEEIGNFPDPAPILKLLATLRSAKGVPVGFRATANPGGPGHNWVKARYVDPAPEGYRIITDPVTGLQRVYIPSRVSDNPALAFADPLYVSRLRGAGSAELVRAWLEGDWSVVAGAFFDGWSLARHVVRPFEVPRHWLRFRAFDWGYARPFSCGWWAVVSDDHALEDGRVLPRGCLVRYREWYGAASPNAGLRLDAEQVADGIKARETGETVAYGVADPAMFAQDGGPSIAERMQRRGVIWERADNKRVPGAGSLGGWDQVRARLRGEGEDRPMLVAFETCRDLIRTLPSLQHDPRRPEDLDTDGEDHAADEARYACMSRPWAAPSPEKTAPKRIVIGGEGTTVTLEDLMPRRAGGRGRL
jgi:hypothetical protein